LIAFVDFRYMYGDAFLELFVDLFEHLVHSMSF
jgi:hypothetical protein